MASGHLFHPTVLREYDIRGIVGETLSVEDARAVGRAFGTYVRRSGGTTAAVGYDGRVSSVELSQAVIEGLVSTGCDVRAVGLGPTPMLYFAQKHLGTDGGLMVTGSHNPANYNGFKMALASGPVYGDAIQGLGKIAASGDFETGAGSIEILDLSEAYVERLLQDFHGDQPMTVAWDAGNGATGDILRRVVARLPGRHVLLFDDIDGRFPNHHPDPTVEANLADLRAAVAREGCDLGVAFDGDGDRIGAIDADGNIVWGDQLLAIYATEVLAEHPGATIIADIKASQTLFDEVARLGGTPLMWRTGHSLLKAKMVETKSPLAGEMSGHIFFADKYYGFDDALYGAIRLISLVSKSGESLKSLRSRLPAVVNTPELRFDVDETRKFAAIEEVRGRLARVEGIDVNDLDGVRVTTPDGWWLLRASNTQAVLVARAEAKTEEGLARLRGMLVEQLSASGIDAPEGL